MTQTEYSEALFLIRKERNALSKKMDELYEDYRREHRKFNFGDKVRLVCPHYSRGDEVFEVFLSGCGVHDDGEIYYQFKKCRKDGSMSSHRFYPDDKIKSIELIEAANP